MISSKSGHGFNRFKAFLFVVALAAPLSAFANLVFSGSMGVLFNQTSGSGGVVAGYSSFATLTALDIGADVGNYFPTQVSFSGSSPVFPSGGIVLSALSPNVAALGANGGYYQDSYSSPDAYGVLQTVLSYNAVSVLNSTNISEVTSPVHVAITGGVYDGQSADIGYSPALLPGVSLLSNDSFAALGQLDGVNDVRLDYSTAGGADNYFFSAFDLATYDFFGASSSDPASASFLMPGSFFVQDHSYLVILQANHSVEYSPGVFADYTSSNTISVNVSSHVPDTGLTVIYLALALGSMVIVHRRFRTELALG